VTGGPQAKGRERAVPGRAVTAKRTVSISESFGKFVSRTERQVQIVSYRAFYLNDHVMTPGESIFEQPLQTKGGIVIKDDVWLGVDVTVLDGVRIGQGAVIAADDGSTVHLEATPKPRTQESCP
jgi:acetyltransferase-like isoleucine patch superfamily enzyme